MEQKESYCVVRKNHCKLYKAGHTSSLIDKGDYYLAIGYPIFNSGALDIHELRSGKGIQILETKKRYDISKIHKSKKNVRLFLSDPKQLLDF